ncbi:hypothetical protein ABI59_03415 [Acidobacteria bacterium Mor1]|nr:hypothetical protein ABI59_03415 [Acidobacteria bacterium Mor1]
MTSPIVAIVGAPNVGKSTLFNRLIGRRQAIVTPQAGVTRDRQYGHVEAPWGSFRLIDTGGLTPGEDAPFQKEIEQQAELALSEADLMLFLVDARAGGTAFDQELAARLRKHPLPLILVANKVDSERQEPLVDALYELGLGGAIPISAEHGVGIDELLDAVGEHLADRIEEAAAEEPAAPEIEAPAETVDEEPAREPGPPAEGIRVAIVGRPNVGKSSILNRLLGEERVMVSDIAGTTRDSIDTVLELDGRRYILIDTAGMRRRGRPKEAVEVFSVNRARKAIERADVTVLVLDGSEEFAAQDAHIAGYVVDAHKPMVVAINKWDLLEDREQKAKDWEEKIRWRLRFVKEAPLMLISAKTGQRVDKLMDHVDRLYACAGIRVPTPELNRWLQRISRAEQGAPAKGRSVRLLYAAQTGVHPPTFTLFCNDPRKIHFSLERHLQNSLRENFGFGNAPIRLFFRARRDTRERGS